MCHHLRGLVPVKTERTLKEARTQEHREHPGSTVCDTLLRTAANVGPCLWPKEGVTTPVHTNAQGKAGLEDIQARAGIYTVPKQVDSARG